MVSGEHISQLEHLPLGKELRNWPKLKLRISIQGTRTTIKMKMLHTNWKTLVIHKMNVIQNTDKFLQINKQSQRLQ